MTDDRPCPECEITPERMDRFFEALADAIVRGKCETGDALRDKRINRLGTRIRKVLEEGRR